MPPFQTLNVILEPPTGPPHPCEEPSKPRRTPSCSSTRPIRGLAGFEFGPPERLEVVPMEGFASPAASRDTRGRPVTGSWTPICCRILLPALLLVDVEPIRADRSTPWNPQSEPLRPRSRPDVGPVLQGGLQQVSFSVEGDRTDPCIDHRGRTIAFASNQHGPRTTSTFDRPRERHSPGSRRIPGRTSCRPSPRRPTTRLRLQPSGQYDIYVVDLAEDTPSA